MATATLTETPEKIVDWMKKFGFDPRTVAAKESSDLKKDAEEIAKLLGELQALPNFDALLKRFGELADAWQWGTDMVALMDQFGTGSDGQMDRSVKKDLKTVLEKLKRFKAQLAKAKAKGPQPGGKPADPSEEVRRAFAAVTINQSIIAERLDTTRPGDQLFADALDHRVAEATKNLPELLAPAGNPAETAKLDLHRKLAVAELEVIAKDQRTFLATLKKYAAQDGAGTVVRDELASLITQIESNLKFARQAPLRDDTLAKVDQCESDFTAERAIAQNLLSTNQLNANSSDFTKLKELAETSRALLGNRALFLQASDTVPRARAECDGRFATASNRLQAIKADVDRLSAVDKAFPAQQVTADHDSASKQLEKARTDAYASFEKVIKEKKPADVLTPLRAAFDAIDAAIAKLRAEIDDALAKGDRLELAKHDLQKLVDDAQQALQKMAGPADLKADFEALVDKTKGSLSVDARLLRLVPIRERCLEALAEFKEGDHRSPDYWQKKSAAFKDLEAEKKALLKDRPKIGERFPAATQALAEAELHYRRDEVDEFARVHEFIAISQNIRKGPAGDAEFQKMRLFVLPMIESGRAIDKTLGKQFDDLVAKQAPTGKDVSALMDLYVKAQMLVGPEYKKWEQAAAKTAKKSQLLRRFCDLTDGQAGSGKQPNPVGQLKTQAAACLKDYDAGMRLGDCGEYPGAIAALDKFLAAADAVEQALNQLADSAIDSAKTPVDEKGKPLQNSAGKELGWSGPTAELKDSSYGFNTTRDAMRYTAGQQMTADGTLVVSAELDDIAKFLDFKLKKFREVCALGQDPLQIARKVFDPVPENFWPPDAVRVMAAFSAAEQEFDDERLRKEARELGLHPDKAAEVGELRRQIEEAKQQKVPPETLKEIRTQMLKEGAKSVIEEGTEDAARLGQLLAVGGFWTQTNDYGVGEIGKFPTTQDGEAAPGKDVGYAGDFLELAANIVKVEMSAKELHDAYNAYQEEKAKRDFRTRKEDQRVISPVKKKLLEYERNRAIATLINSATDTVLSALSAGGHIPGMNIAGDVKALAIAAMEAGRYFAMLDTSKALKEGSENDPDSITYLGLARQAEEEGLAGGQQCFVAAMKILKLTGDVVQLSGHAAPAGFAINLTSQGLEMAGNFCFKVYDWHDASNQIKFIQRAKRKPADYQAVAEVFSNTRKYARFCIAWGCLHDDSWARSWVISRGLTDRDLDNPETSTAIIRQYINTTQESLLGQTQNEDPETFSNSMPGKALKGLAKVAGKANDAISEQVLDLVTERNRTIKSQHFSYTVGDDGLTYDSWNTNLFKAFTPGGLFQSALVTRLGKKFKQLDAAIDAMDKAAAGDPGDKEADDEFRVASAACENAFVALREALANYEPTANPHGKEPHECMKLYLGDLLMEIGKQSAARSQERDAYWKKSFLNKAKDNPNDPDDPAKAAKLQAQEQAEAEKALRKQVAKFNDLRSKAVDERLRQMDFDTLYGKFKIAEPAARQKLAAAAVDKLQLKTNPDRAKLEKALTAAIDTAAAALRERIWRNLSGLKPEFDDGGVSLPKEFDAQFKLQSQTAANEFAAAVKSACAAAVADPVGQYTFNDDNKYPTPLGASPDATKLYKEGVAAWTKTVAEASNEKTGGWIKTGNADQVAKSLGSFAKVNSKLYMMFRANEKSLEAQAAWRIALAALQGSLESLPCATKFGTDHPGMVELRDRFLAQLAEYEQQTVREMARVNQTVDWKPPESFFMRLNLTSAHHKDVIKNCLDHLLDEKSIGKQSTKLFEDCEKTSARWNIVANAPGDFTAAEANQRYADCKHAWVGLRDVCQSLHPVYSVKHPRAGEQHDGMCTYLNCVQKRIGDDGKEMIKYLNDTHAGNAAKYKAAP